MLKKYLMLSCLILMIVGFILPVFAENFTYKVYDPKTNTSYNAVLGTLSISADRYVFAFYTPSGQPLCAIQMGNVNKNKQNLESGKCIEFGAFMNFFRNSQQIDQTAYFPWRELSADTLYREAQTIIIERRAQGKEFYNGQ